MAEIRNDTSLNKIVKAINGYRCVKQVSQFTKLDETHVKICLQHLYYHRMIEFVDFYQDTNIYKITSNIGNILTIHADESVLSVSKTLDFSEIDEIFIFESYCKLSDKSVREFRMENPEFENFVDMQRFIKYGVVRNIISRVHRYFVKYNENQLRKTKTTSLDLETIRKMSPYLDGKHSCDEIICVCYDHKLPDIEKTVEDACLSYLK